MMLIADKQILCGSCGALVGLGWTITTYPEVKKYPRVVVKDCYVVSIDESVFYCNEECKRKAQV